MVDKLPLLDGSEIDLDHDIHALDLVDQDRTITLREDFAREQLPWWLSYQTQNGPANPVFNGLSSAGGDTTITLDPGSNIGDVSVLEGPTINWDNWTEIRAYAWGLSGATEDVRSQVSLGDGIDANIASEAFYATNLPDSRRYVVSSGGVRTLETADASRSVTSTHTMGFRIFENETTVGHTCDFVDNGEHRVSAAEQDGFPSATDLTFRFGVRCETDGVAETLDIDGILIQLIP